MRSFLSAVIVIAALQGLLAVLQSAATAGIAANLAGGNTTPRYAGVLAANSFVALTIATVVSGVLQWQDSVTRTWFRAAAVLLCLAAVVPTGVGTSCFFVVRSRAARRRTASEGISEHHRQVRLEPAGPR